MLTAELTSLTAAPARAPAPQSSAGSAGSAVAAAARLLGDRYELGALLGRGGMADVYRARDRRSGGFVAVKVFRPGVGSAGDSAGGSVTVGRRRRREVQVMRRLDHPGLAALLDADLDGDAALGSCGGDGCGESGLGHGQVCYVVMQLVDGPTLRQQISHAPLAERQVASLGATLCDALHYIHRRGIVHRDIKPANILLAPGSDAARLEPKLTDFGVARVVDSTRMTTEGFTVGTANYLSPEQVKGETVGTASDVYSLALVLLEALTGQIAFPGHGIEAALARLHRKAKPPEHLNPAFAGLLDEMTATNPTQRPSADVVGSRLRRIADPSLSSDILALGDLPDAGLPNADHANAEPRAAAPRRPYRLLGAAGALVAAATATAVVLAAGDTGIGSRPIKTGPHPNSSTAATPAGELPSRGAPAATRQPPSHPAAGVPGQQPRPTAAPAARVGLIETHTATATSGTLNRAGHGAHGSGRSKAHKKQRKKR